MPGGHAERIGEILDGAAIVEEAPSRSRTARETVAPAPGHAGVPGVTFAFGPSLVGNLRDWAGTYGPALGVCAALQAIAAGMIRLGPGDLTRARIPAPLP